MNRKIAITGLSGCKHTLLAPTLSNLTGFPFIRNKTMYEWCRLCNVADPNKPKMKDLLMIALFSFLERVVIESYYDQFISDGISFTELILFKSHFEKQHPDKRLNKWSGIVENLEKVSASYAAQQYDIIIHICDESDIYTNDLYIQLLRKYNLPYKMYNNDNLENVISEIVNDLGLHQIISIENAIYHAKTDTFKR